MQPCIPAVTLSCELTAGGVWAQQRQSGAAERGCTHKHLHRITSCAVYDNVFPLNCIRLSAAFHTHCHDSTFDYTPVACLAHNTTVMLGGCWRCLDSSGMLCCKGDGCAWASLHCPVLTLVQTRYATSKCGLPTIYTWELQVHPLTYWMQGTA